MHHRNRNTARHPPCFVPVNTTASHCHNRTAPTWSKIAGNVVEEVCLALKHCLLIDTHTHAYAYTDTWGMKDERQGDKREDGINHWIIWKTRTKPSARNKRDENQNHTHKNIHMWKQMPYLFADKHNRGIITRKPDRMAFVFFQYHKHAPNSCACTHVTCAYTATIDSFFVGKRGTCRPSSYMHMNNRNNFPQTRTIQSYTHRPIFPSTNKGWIMTRVHPITNTHTYIPCHASTHISIPRTLRVSFVHSTWVCVCVCRHTFHDARQRHIEKTTRKR